MIVDLIKENEEKIKELEREAYKVFLLDGQSKKWRQIVRKIAGLRMVSSGYVNLLRAINHP